MTLLWVNTLSWGDTGLVNTVLFYFAGLSGGCGGKAPVW